MTPGAQRRMMAKLAADGFPVDVVVKSKGMPEPLLQILPIKPPTYTAPGPYGQRMYPMPQAEVDRLLEKGRIIMAERAKAAQAAAATPQAREAFRNSPEGRNQWNVQDDFRNGPEGYQVVNTNKAGNMSRPTANTIDPETGKLMGPRAGEQNWRNFYQKGEDAFAMAAPLTAAPGLASGGTALMRQVAGQSFKSSVRPLATAAGGVGAAGAVGEARRSLVGSIVAGAHPPKPPSTFVPPVPWVLPVSPSVPKPPPAFKAPISPSVPKPPPVFKAPIGFNKEAMLDKLRERLEEPDVVKTATEQEPHPSANKTKHTVLGLGGMALGGHVLSNMGMKTARAVAYNKGGLGAAVRSILPRSARNYVVNKGSNDMASGIVSGIVGKSPSFGRQVAETWLSPETVANQHVGEAIGRGLRAGRTNAAGKVVEPSKGSVIRKLKKIRKAMAMNPDMQDAVVARNIIPGINRALDSGELMNRAAPESGLKKAVKGVGAVLAGAPLAVLDPAMAIHAGINKARVITANSSVGHAFNRNQALQGLGAAAREQAEKHGLGFLAPKAPAFEALRNAAVEYGISPMARDAAGISGALTRSAINNPSGAGRLVGAAAALNPSVASGARVVMSHPLANKLRAAQRAAQPQAHVASEELRRRLAEHKAKRAITVP